LTYNKKVLNTISELWKCVYLSIDTITALWSSGLVYLGLDLGPIYVVIVTSRNLNRLMIFMFTQIPLGHF